jgi:hypothetical protein
MTPYANITHTYSAELHRWPYVYLHGDAEFPYNPEGDAPDIFLADAPKPEAGNYLVIVRGEPALAVIAMHYGILCGRVALLSDTKAMKHILSVDDWR